LERVEEGIRCCDEALIFNKTKFSLLVQKAKLLAVQRKDEAIQLCDDLIRLYPDIRNGYSMKANILSTLGRREEALEVIIRSRQVFPNDPEFHLDHGRLLVSLARKQEAIQCFDEILLKDERYVATYESKIKLLLDSDEKNENLDFIRCAIGRFPAKIELYNQTIHTLSALERNEDALECVEELIIKDPKKHKAYFTTKLKLLNKLGRSEERLKFLNAVLEFDWLTEQEKKNFTDIRDLTVRLATLIKNRDSWTNFDLFILFIRVAGMLFLTWKLFIGEGVLWLWILLVVQSLKDLRKAWIK